MAEKTIAGSDVQASVDLKRQLALSNEEIATVRKQAQREVNVARESCELELAEREQAFAAQVSELRQKSGAGLPRRRCHESGNCREGQWVS